MNVCTPKSVPYVATISSRERRVTVITPVDSTAVTPAEDQRDTPRAGRSRSSSRRAPREPESRAEKKGRTRQALLDTTMDLVADRSFSGLSLREVARGAGIVPTAFYRHFTSMEDLGVTLVEDSMRVLRRTLREGRRDLAARNALPTATNSLEILLDHVRTNEAQFRFLVREQHGGVPEIRRAIDTGSLVMLSPFGFSHTGEAFNLSMEDVATSAAIALQADKLIFVTEVRGILQNIVQEPAKAKELEARQHDPEVEIDQELALAEAKRLLAALPNPLQPTDTAFYLQHAVKASEGGVERVHIIPFLVDGALLMEVFTHDGVGTMIVDEKLESLREASPDDVGGILQLIEPFEQDGTLVKRSRTEIERDVAQYTVIEHDGVIFGCAALYPFPEASTAEMAALTISPSVQGQGDGERILKRIEQRARAMGLSTLFVLTTRTMHWFIKRGFAPVDPAWLPEARKRSYKWDRRSQVLVKQLK